MPLYTFIHNFLDVLVQIANKMGLQKKNVPFACVSLQTRYVRSIDLLSCADSAGHRPRIIGAPIISLNFCTPEIVGV
jgi:hypothetical protein